MNTIFVNSKNSKTSDPDRLCLNLTYKINLTSDKYLALLSLSMYYIWRNIKKSYKNIRTLNLKYQLEHGMKNLKHLVDHILYQIFQIILNIY